MQKKGKCPGCGEDKILTLIQSGRYPIREYFCKNPDCVFGKIHPQNLGRKT